VAQPINIPIRFRFLKVPIKWELTGTDLSGKPRKIDLEERSLSELDGWQCRREFLDLRENDPNALLAFLDKVGMWQGTEAPYWPIKVLRVESANVWDFREDLKSALLYPKNFMDQLAPQIPAPKTLLDLYLPHPANDFRLRFELSRVAAGVVTILNAREMLLATALTDVARGIRFKSCKRKDCGRPFPIESEHERKYCSQYCGHLESLRRKRREEQKKRG